MTQSRLPSRRVASTPESIFQTISQLSAQHEAVDLGQGFPDDDGPRHMLELAAEAILGTDGHPQNQYAPLRGEKNLREAIAKDRARKYGQTLDPDTEILVTVGATEALAASVLGLVNPGQEVVALSPYYDAYPAITALAEASFRPVGLRREEGWSIDREAFRAAVTENTAAVILNTPHNPTGAVLSREDMEFVAEVVRDSHAVVIADEVYERLVYPGGEHLAFATLPGMAERTVSISGASKNFNATGWKTGWVCAPEELLAPIITAKQFLTFSGAHPMQNAVAWALEEAEEWSAEWLVEMRHRRTVLAEGLTRLGFTPLETQGTYFLLADIAEVCPGMSAHEFCKTLPEKAGVAAIPLTAFTHDPEDPSLRTLVRWTFCKSESNIQRALGRLEEHFG